MTVPSAGRDTLLKTARDGLPGARAEFYGPFKCYVGLLHKTLRFFARPMC